MRKQTCSQAQCYYVIAYDIAYDSAIAWDNLTAQRKWDSHVSSISMLLKSQKLFSKGARGILLFTLVDIIVSKIFIFLYYIVYLIKLGYTDDTETIP